MNIISYRYTNTFKQFLLIICMIYFLLCAAIVCEVVIFDVPGYEVNVIGALFLYAAIFVLLAMIFIGYKFFYTLYDDDTIIYYNKLLKKEYSANFADIKKVVLHKRGVSFYADSTSTTAALYIPFFRGGIIDALEIDKFYRFLKAKEGIDVVKEFTVLPGYGKGFTVLKVVYVFLSAYVLLLCATPLVAVIVLFQNFV